ncbi:MAG: purine-nucleoside phosphorylase [Chlamydiales bacterium]|jgi:purine-nucleoside phosphorylase
MKTLTLVEAVQGSCDALRDAGAPDPDVLWLLGTGTGTLPGSFASHREIPLGSLAGLPAPWCDRVLHTGTLSGTTIWMLDDGPDDPRTPQVPGVPDWARPLPCWIAAASGATLCIHTSAGITLRDDGTQSALEVGTLALTVDHINLSGQTPLRGIGENTLGPLFPDQTRLHHTELRERVLERARELGISAHEAVVACTLGPSLSTPAELRWYKAVGAAVAVQDLAAPLIASAHAGLAMLSIVALTDSGSKSMRMRDILERTEACAPALEDLLLASAGDFAAFAADLEQV